MQEALKSIFGPAAGLFGILFFLIVLMPKFVVRWRGFKARRIEKRSAPERDLGSRSLNMDACPDVAGMDPHVVHGVAIASFSCCALAVLLESACWILPCVAIFYLVPDDIYSRKLALSCIAVFLGIVGILTLRHLGDHVTFYRTGCTGQLKGKRFNVDYNAIVSYTKRRSLIPGLSESIIVHLNDGELIVFESMYLKSGRKLSAIFSHLGERIIHNASEEKKRLLS